jgi:hypothetical protein
MESKAVHAGRILRPQPARNTRQAQPRGSVRGGRTIAPRRRLPGDEAMTANARPDNRDTRFGQRAARREQLPELECRARCGDETADGMESRDVAHRASASDRKRRDAQRRSSGERRPWAERPLELKVRAMSGDRESGGCPLVICASRYRRIWRADGPWDRWRVASESGLGCSSRSTMTSLPERNVRPSARR